MNPSAWTVQDWVLIIGLFGGGVATILKSQHSLISKLLVSKWDEHEKRLNDHDDICSDVESSLHGLDLRINTVETVCNMRKVEREKS